ncbi:MAG TPA: cytochrome b/b6 domain-containing protein [Novosphingobium sp.]|nr:cytochrome b/b6 domain-containing protein [Novosphingobium sp.]HZV11052.1 cytochrome b/b6 domain-containing protein [Novosphingobium sp.]
MTTSADAIRYTRMAVLLHWAIALMIGCNLTLGWFMEGFAPPLKGVVLPLHISCGLSVLALSVVRIVWRLLHVPPPAPVGRLEQGAAHIVHFLLYAGMVVLPLTGWAILSAHPAPGSQGFAAEQARMAAQAGPAVHRLRPKPGITAWWVIPVPAIGLVQAVGDTPGGLPAQKRLHDSFVDWHEAGGWAMIALLALHIAGALKHQWVDRQPFLQRMSWQRMSWRRR